jgi:hypothetical protein
VATIIKKLDNSFLAFHLLFYKIIKDMRKYLVKA